MTRLVYFSADDGVHGRELWVTDGTPVGTRMVRDTAPGPQGGLPGYFSSDLTSLGD
ncbi:MAG: ELWxxDGT repeat protein, partial [Pararhodobacter sp.]